MSSERIRIVGLTDQILQDRQAIQRVNCASNLFGAVGRCFDLVDLRRVRVTGLQKYVGLARTYRRDMPAWKMASTLSPQAFRDRSSIARNILHEYEGKFDLALQLFSIFSSGGANYPYAVYTDNTYQLSQRYWTQWVPDVSTKVHEEWLALERETYQNARVVFCL